MTDERDLQAAAEVAFASVRVITCTNSWHVSNNSPRLHIPTDMTGHNKQPCQHQQNADNRRSAASNAYAREICQHIFLHNHHPIYECSMSSQFNESSPDQIPVYLLYDDESWLVFASKHGLGGTRLIIIITQHIL